MGKHILFISYDGMTDPLGQSQVIPYLAGLTRQGYHFTILSCDKPEKYAAKKEYVLKLLEGLPIDWISIPYHKNPPVLSSMFDVAALKREASRLHKRKPVDMVHTRPGVPTLVGLWLKKKFGIRFLNDVRGFWADERVDGGMWNLKNPLFRRVYKFFKAHEYECLELADHNVCLTHVAKKEMLTWDNIKAQPLKIQVVPCSADLELFNPINIDLAEREKIKNELGFKDGEMIISYLGSIGGWYLTDEMMQFCKLLSDKIPHARFLFISPHRHEDIIQAAGKYGMSEEKIITRNASRHEVPVLLSFSDYSIFFIKPCYSKMSSSPTKHGEIMAMGIPVITNGGVGDVEDIVTRYQAGYVVKDFTHASYNEVIEKIKTGNTFDKNAIRQGAFDFYALEDALLSYTSVYRQVLGA